MESVLYEPADAFRPTGGAPEVTILIPALNEELTIGDFVDWCWIGIRKADVSAEILIVDSSQDKTADIALSKGARVLKTPKRGLGRAYIDGLSHARGKYLLLGDSDCTYDFREIGPFLAAFRQGAEYIMGSRVRGSIEPGAMPALHRYLGTPVTTWILNFIYSSHFTDIHCGMRGITKAAFERLNMQSQGWQYASEMVLKAIKLKLRIAEVPIHFLKDRNGRISHLKRSGWMTPWKAGWDNLKAMFLYGPDFFLVRPGLLFLAAGLALMIPGILGGVAVGPVTFSLHWMLLGSAAAMVGLQCFYLGILARGLTDLRGVELKRWVQRVDYNWGVLLSLVLFLAGCSLCVPLMVEYFSDSLALPVAIGRHNYFAVFGLFLIVSGFLTFCFTILLHSLDLFRQERRGNGS